MCIDPPLHADHAAVGELIDGQRRMETMKTITSNLALVAYCGLYCGACGSYLKGRCSGCHDNPKATWCKVRSCCMERGYSSCTDCRDFDDPEQCGKYNNFISRIVGFVLRSDRVACIRQIKAIGIQGHADTMTKQRQQTIRKGTAQPSKL
jgi:hypothetical protein